MQSKKELTNEIEIVNTLSDLIKTYEEVYLLKMYRTRNSVLNTREYYTRLLALYQSIKNSYKDEILQSINKDNKNKDLSVLTKPKKQVAVFISGNDRFAGEVNNKIFKDFIDFYAKNKPDLVIVGSIGKGLMHQRASTIRYQYFELEESFGVSSSEKLKAIVKYLINYKDVRLFHGEFQNMVTQTAINRSITGEMGGLTMKDNNSNSVQKGKYFLFEPSLTKMLKFFETQIFASLFKRGVEEATLAQIGARVSSLETSTISIGKRLKLLKYNYLKTNKREKNSKQQDLLVGINFWESQNVR